MSRKVKVDHENIAETFWANLDEQLPEIAAKLRESDEVELTDEEWATVQAVEGFGNGPSYAPTALVEA